MTRGSKITLGILTFLPFVLMFVYFFSIGFLVRDAILHQDESSPFPILADVFWLVIVALVMGLLCFGLLIYYIIHVINNKFIESNEKLLWVLVFLFASIVGFPIYWYMRIWKGPEVITMSAT
jgi:Phospholipase_D-nuclease N-terminal